MTDLIRDETDESAALPSGESVGTEDMTVVSSTAPLSDPGQRNSSFAELAKLLEGQQLDHFQLLETIGGGGMGVVFRAVDTQLGRTVAVKVLSRYEAGDKDALIRFKNEAQSAARLDHVNIARVYFVGEDKGWHYIVFEYIDGINVRDLVERGGSLSVADAVSFTLQMAEALSHASRRDVVHRDIKPSNVLITEERRAKLVDMGLARLHQEEHSSDDLTASGVTLGTFDYISPEQARNPRNTDVRSDIYSLGCTLYFMLAGRPPFPEGTVLQKLLQHQSEPPPDLRQFRTDIPEELLAISDKMLAKNPSERFQDASLLIAELQALAERLGIRTGSISGLTVLPASSARLSAWTKHLPWLLPVATLAFAVVLLEMFWSTRAASSPPPPVHGTLRALRPTTSETSAASVAPERIEFDSSNLSPVDASQSVRESNGESKGRESTERDASAPKDVSGNLSRIIETLEGKMPPKTTDGLAKLPQDPDGAPPRAIDEQDKVASGKTSTTLGGGDDKSRDTSNSSPRENALPTNDKPLGDAVSKGRLLIVGDSDMYTGESHYATLFAACQAAKSGDAIELRYDGARIERPIRFSQQPLTIRAGNRPDGNRYRPKIVFRPNESDMNEYDKGMFVLETGASLRIIGAHLVLDPGEVAAQQWSLISLVDSQSIKISHCWLTIQNAADNDKAYHQDVAFFHVRPSTKQGVMKMVDPSRTEKVVSIELSNCVVRGEARVLQIDELELVDFEWNNGLCATTEPLLFAEGGKSDASQSAAASRIALRHLTAVLGGGLCKISSRKNAPYQRPFHLHCADSILVSNDNAPLIDQIGLRDVRQIKELLTFTGERMFYQGFSEFWRIDSRQAVEIEISVLDFTEWRSHWKENELYAQLNRVAWQRRPDLAKAAHQYMPADFLLEEAASNPAKGGGEGGASDGKDAGMLWESLSDFAAEDVPLLDAEEARRTSSDDSTDL